MEDATSLDQAAQSALHANIAEKGDRAYYYAHKRKETGEAPAPLPEPCLLAKEIVVPEETPVSISTYQFLDEDKVVKIYVPLEGVGSLPVDAVSCSFEARCFDLRVRGHASGNGKSLRLGGRELHDDVVPEGCSYKVMANKVVVTLAKVAGKSGSCARWSKLLK